MCVRVRVCVFMQAWLVQGGGESEGLKRIGTFHRKGGGESEGLKIIQTFHRNTMT